MKQEKSIFLLLMGLVLTALGALTAATMLMSIASIRVAIQILGQPYLIAVAVSIGAAAITLIAGILGIAHFRAQHRARINIILGILAFFANVGVLIADKVLLVSLGLSGTIDMSASLIGMIIGLAACALYTLSAVLFYNAVRK